MFFSIPKFIFKLLIRQNNNYTVWKSFCYTVCPKVLNGDLSFQQAAYSFTAYKIYFVRHVVDCSSKVISAAVASRHHTFFRSAGVTEHIKMSIKGLPFGSELLFQQQYWWGSGWSVALDKMDIGTQYQHQYKQLCLHGKVHNFANPSIVYPHLLKNHLRISNIFEFLGHKHWYSLDVLCIYVIKCNISLWTSSAIHQCLVDSEHLSPGVVSS